MSTKNSTLVANYEASPQVMSKVYQLVGRVRTAQGTIALATADLTLADIVMLAPLPTAASILSIKLAADDMDSGSPALTWDLGLYTDAGVAVDSNAYAVEIILGQAVTAFTEYRFESANITTCGQQIWEDGGVAENPDGGMYYVALTVTAAPATAVAGDLSFIIEYVVD